MIAYEDALRALLDAAGERGVQQVQNAPLKELAGRVCAARVESPEALPAFDNSAMDGFAVAASRLAQAAPERPVRLPLVGLLAAGDAPACAPAGSGAWEIMTGAPLPPGCDAVVRVEDVERAGDGAVLFRRPAEPGESVRPAGTDIAAGQLLAEPGTLLDERHVLALAAVGIDRVSVRCRPTVALLSTGAELAAPGAAPAPGQIRNATGPYLAAALAAMGCELRRQHAVGDEPRKFEELLAGCLEERPDLVIVTGAVSMGRRDFVPASLQQLGAELLFHKAAVRPGKPLLAARFSGDCLLFGLPGNPVSTAVGLRFFVAPVVRALLGRPQERPLRARLAAEHRKPQGLRCFFKAALSVGPKGAEVRVLPGQASYQIGPLLQADAWAVLPEPGASVPAGAEVEVYPLR